MILDQHTSVRSSPGTVPVAQLNALTGRHWPVAVGLLRPFRTLGDAGQEEDEDRVAVRATLDVLRGATEQVSIVVVGSCRDVAAAYNADPSVFEKKVGRLVIFAGDASARGFVENNVALDPLAFVRLMSSGLPIRWVPCFDGGMWNAGSRSSFVQVEQAKLFPDDLPEPLMKYFAYMLHKESTDLSATFPGRCHLMTEPY